MKTINVIVLAGIILLSACKSKDTPEPERANTATKSASFKVGGTAFDVFNSSRDLFHNNATINNNLQLIAPDGSKVEFNFVGNTPATYSLDSGSNAYYKNAEGKQYNSTSGQLVVSEVTSYKISGTFSFWAKAIVSPYDSLQITEGIILLTIPN